LKEVRVLIELYQFLNGGLVLLKPGVGKGLLSGWTIFWDGIQQLE
jgi:hypothetical protein